MGAVLGNFKYEMKHIGLGMEEKLTGPFGNPTTELSLKGVEGDREQARNWNIFTQHQVRDQCWYWIPTEDRVD